MKPINASEDTWLRAETTNEKFEQDTPTQNGDDMQSMLVFYKTQLEAPSHH